MNRTQALLLAARPRTLPAAAAPVVVGCAIAYAAGTLHPLRAAVTLLFSLLIQVGTNYVNDVLDFERGTDNETRVGPLRATQAGLLSPRAVKLAATATFALAAAIGLYLAAVAGWQLVVIGVASIVAGIAYTGGPSPLAYNGLGDVFVMLFFGFVAVCGTVFVQLGHVPPLAWAAAVPVGALTTAILVVNNVRDVDTDRTAGRRTVPVRFGRSVGVAEYGALLGLAFAAPVALVAARLAGPFALLPLLVAPLGIRLARTLSRTTGPALNRTLAGTAQLLLFYSVLLSLGVVLSPAR